MIPALNHLSATQERYQNFVTDLGNLGFEGERCLDYANRTVLATDNSIYQVLPQGVIYPKHVKDLLILTQLSQKAAYRDIVLSPRGGGTGTNGQSLTDGLVIDTSRHMNQILEINVEERWARVQCGVVKDQLNAAIESHGLFFAPELSTSNRATIGGMINTDASGQGSCTYGKTRDHVLELSTVLMDGTLLQTSPVDMQTLEQEKSREDMAGNIYRIVDQLDRQNRDEIQRAFPPLNRCLTGYDLAHLRTADDKLDLNSLLCGSEGTLGFIVEATLNLLPVPKKTALVNLRYDNFDSALRDAEAIMKVGPTSIETIDSLVLNLAKDDNVWDSVAEFFPEDEGQSLAGINLVEYTADSEQELKEKLAPLLQQLDNNDDNRSHGYTVARDEEVDKIWAMRKKAVGLLGNIQGEARPVAFVEDTCVPPHHLADYIAEFRQLLDSHHLNYGMFGHVDAGVLHVRPILDMKNPEDERKVRIISDQVVELTHKYGGLLWGEHGKGVRSEYAPRFFGALYPLLQTVKQAFDPYNQLNPGKIATPAADIPLLKIDAVATRGQYDKTIDGDSWKGFQEGMFCNGNGACHNWDPNDAMCPSWKATRKRTHTPKGRASLIREWLRQLQKQGVSADSAAKKLASQSWFGNCLNYPKRLLNTIGSRRGNYDFSHEVHESMMACLACKSCTGSCPVKVDVPEFRSKFLSLYYSRYARPLKDYFVASLERTLPVANRVGFAYNLLMDSSPVRGLLSRFVGLTDSPLLTRVNFDQALRERQVSIASYAALSALTEEQKQKSVILVQDSFTRFFETELVLDTLDLLKALGFSPWVAPYLANGKPLHVHGFRQAFSKVAHRTAGQLKQLQQTGIPLVGLEPSMTLAYRGEYKTVDGLEAPNVLLFQEWLAQQKLPAVAPSGKTYKLLAHCTEKTNALTSIKCWQKVFSDLGHKLEVINVGCCGMAGTFGHETANVKNSEAIYRLSWEAVVENSEHQGQLLATGFSCRSQAKRFSEKHLPHPVQVLQ
ncbi:MAG: FAD/FMN-containing dehydrogenase/Fe-S oxidoreductase [Cellvibrionaceae bacterium]|jgi:FAD/FMN-containing dehydrogenase/Fe-S oxidoreductase